MASITDILKQIESGNIKAKEELFERVYAQFRQLVKSQKAKQSDDALLQTTAVVNEACMKMADQGFNVSFANRQELFAAANRAIKLTLIDYTRSRNAQKRKPDNEFLVERFLQKIEVAVESDYVDLHEALQELSVEYPRVAQVIEYRFFGRLTIAETAELLAISTDTVKRDWRFGRAFLFNLLGNK